MHRQKDRCTDGFTDGQTDGRIQRQVHGWMDGWMDEDCSVVQVTKLCDFSSSEPQDSVCSVAWSQRGTYLSVGTNNGETQLWDVSKIKMIRTMQVDQSDQPSCL